MYSNWRNITPPKRMAALPKDPRGYPIPVLVYIDSDGKPDFRTTDIRKWIHAAKSRTCGICGEVMGRKIAFIGGPLTAKNRYFTDFAMHRDCAEYAVQVCPFIAARNFKYAEEYKEEEGVIKVVSSTMSAQRPTKFIVGITTSYEILRTDEGFVVRAGEWDELVWWENGSVIEAPWAST